MATKIIEVIFIMFFVIGAHELGHLIAGLIQGFRFYLFVAGPLGIKRENHKIKVYFNTNLAYYGGVAATLPVDDNPKNIKKFANLILAGPIVSLVLAIICLLITHLFNTPVEKILNIIATGSLGIFLATTIPSKTGTFFTDRKRYQRLMSNGKEKDIEVAVLRLMGIYSRDNSYKNVNIDDINLMIQDSNYQYLGLFTKLCFEHETLGHFNSETKFIFDELTQKMPKSIVKVTTTELNKLK